MLLWLAAVQAVAHYLAKAMFGVVTVLPAVVALALFHRAAEGIVAIVDALVVHHPVVPLAELPFVQQVGGRIVTVAFGVRQRTVLA